jgi:sarcosine oxidase subunit beta
MKSKADVVIIGGGIQGISLAYYLALKGVSDVCVLEMDTLGSGSSGRSAAVIGHAFQSAACLPMTQWSFKALMRFEDEVGADPGYEPIGCLLLAGGESAAPLRRRHELLKDLGVESHLVDTRAIGALCPGLHLADIEFGLYNAGEGCIDPHSIMMGYVQDARRRGVEFNENVRATGLTIEGGRVMGVDTSKGRIATPCAVNAAGAGAHEVAAWANLHLPITNLKRHIFFTGPVPTYARSIPFTYDAAKEWYMRREGPGLLIGMGAEESDEADPQVDWAYLDEVIEHSLFRAPPLEQAGVRSGWAGLRPVTPDEDPILGPVEQVSGFYNDCGWGGHGIMHAPAAGNALAEWIVDGKPRAVDIRPFAAGRFG